MALELRQQLKLAQKLVMTPQLRQAIKLLQLNRLELTDALQSEMEQNPLLEEADNPSSSSENPESLSAEENKEIPEAAATAQVKGDDPSSVAEVNWEDYANTFDSDFSFAREIPPADAPSQFDFISATPGLTSHLQWQLTHLKLNELDKEISHFILGNLDGHGFFQADIEDICNYVHCPTEEAEGVLRLVQSLEPPGIAARNIRESLLLQLERQGLDESLAYHIVDEHMDSLQTRNYALIARMSDVTARKVQAAVAVITTLTPYPGNEFSNEQTNYVIPDVYVDKIDGEFVIRLNNDGLPHLQISTSYQEMIKESKKINKDSRNYLQEKKRSAQWFIKSLQQRQRTIYKVMESLLKFQHDFFEKGPGHLKPLILHDVADDIGMHESTVSRVTSNKYVHTPTGIYELKYFFSTAVATTNGDTIAAEAIKNRIKQIIQKEDSTKPLSDNKLSALLKEEGIKVARRTVAKYRDQLKILPVKHRRKARR
jgi:RNA polymerase sigma-54 factor